MTTTLSPEITRVLVVDRYSSRARANARAWVQAGCHCMVCDDGGASEGGNWAEDDPRWGNPWKLGETQARYTLVFLHFNDSGKWKGLLTRGVEAGVVINYSGGTPGSTSNSELWFCSRAISGPADAITTTEARQVKKWIEEGCSESLMPSVLSGRVANEAVFLDNFCLLCQGYLVAAWCSDARVRDGRSADMGIVRQVLEELGWQKLSREEPELLRLCPEDSREWIEIYDSVRWGKILGPIPEALKLETRHDEGMAALRAAFGVLDSGQALDPVLVARAYRLVPELAARLQVKPTS